MKKVTSIPISEGTKRTNMNIEYLQDYFQTKDLNLSCFLLARGLPFEGLEKGGDHFLFTFSNRNQCMLLEREFWRGSPINVLAFCNAQKTLKTKLFQEKNEKSNDK